jgi:ATP-dependent Lhr-like helicase
MEARGTVRGGRFVSGFIGEQYGLPEAVDGLRRVRRQERDAETLRINATDPLNLAGVITPGPRVAALPRNALVLRDGIPVSVEEGRRVSDRREAAALATLPV